VPRFALFLYSRFISFLCRLLRSSVSCLQWNRILIELRKLVGLAVYIQWLGLCMASCQCVMLFACFSLYKRRVHVGTLLTVDRGLKPRSYCAKSTQLLLDTGYCVKVSCSST